MEIVKTIVLGTYFTILTILSVYGAHRLWMLLLYYRHKKDVPQPVGDPDYLPMVTVQLAVFNEMNVVERLMDYVVTHGLAQGQAGDPGAGRLHRRDRQGGPGRLRPLHGPGLRHQLHPPHRPHGLQGRRPGTTA